MVSSLHDDEQSSTLGSAEQRSWSSTFPELEPARVLGFLVGCRTVGVSSASTFCQWIQAV